MDFVSDSTHAGQRFRVLTVVDDFSRRCVTLVTAISFSGGRVGRALDHAILDAPPETIVMDNGPEFTSKALDQWAHERKVNLHFIRPGKPVENAYAESFNGRFRDECLNTNWFANVLEAREVIDAWRDDYNERRPHSSLDGLTPEEYEDAFNQRKLPLQVA
jgi:putative transposase